MFTKIKRRRRGTIVAVAALVGSFSALTGVSPALAASGYIYGGPTSDSYGWYNFDFAARHPAGGR